MILELKLGIGKQNRNHSD